MKVAILGASGIGKFHVREFNKAGTNVVAILGSTKESAEKTALSLSSSFGAIVKPYSNLKDLLDNEGPDAVSICTPPELHGEQVRILLEKGIHVFCEKPLVSGVNLFQRGKELVELAKKNRKILCVNTQMPAMVEYIPKSFRKDIKFLEIQMEPGKKDILEMLEDHLPHANSLLIYLLGKGTMSNLELAPRVPEQFKCSFNYKTSKGDCNVVYDFKYKADRPRKIAIVINGQEFDRVIGENYTPFLVYSDKKVQMEDPFAVSISKFVQACNGTGNALVSGEDILENLRLGETLIMKFKEVQ